MWNWKRGRDAAMECEAFRRQGWTAFPPQPIQSKMQDAFLIENEYKSGTSA